MGAVRNAAPGGRNRLVDELAEDIDVAIREFLERYPGTSPSGVRQAIRLVERRTYGGRVRPARRALAILALLGSGVILGLLLG